MSKLYQTTLPSPTEKGRKSFTTTDTAAFKTSDLA